MTDPIRQSHRDFIDMMKGGADAESDGFDILSKNPRGDELLGVLVQEGFFKSEKIPRPTKNGEAYRLSRWPAADYLVALAKRLPARDHRFDLMFRILIEISEAAARSQELKDNYLVWHSAAEVLATAAGEGVPQRLAELLPVWLSSQFGNDLVGAQIARGVLPKLLEVAHERENRLALETMRAITSIKWAKRAGLEGNFDEPQAIVSAYWLKEALTANLKPLAARLPHDTAELFLQRLQEVYGASPASWVHRPAVEEHEQNHADFDIAYNFPVDGLRDALLIWVSGASSSAEPVAYVLDLFTSRLEIARRLAVSVIDQRFAELRAHVSAILTRELFDVHMLHETHRLLRSHCKELSHDEVAKLRPYLLDEYADETEEGRRSKCRLQQRFLNALLGSGLADFETRYTALVREYGPVGAHPEFLSFMEMRYGPPPGPFTRAEIIRALREGELVGKLNGFTEANEWEGPSRSGLQAELTDAVQQEPRLFLDAADDFLNAEVGYQYAYLEGYKRLWDDETSDDRVQWSSVWPQLLRWMQAITGSATFWTQASRQQEGFRATHSWLIALMADIVRAGSGNDSRAFEPDLLQAANAIVTSILSELKPDNSDGDDALNHAINSQRGKALETLIGLALRRMRLAEKAGSEKDTIWATLRPAFDNEMQLAESRNSEFLSLVGNYLLQFLYLSESWTEEVLKTAIRFGNRAVADIAVGLMYAQASSQAYSLLDRTGFLDTALSAPEVTAKARKRLLERLALALVWGLERIDGPRLQLLYQTGAETDLASVTAQLSSVGSNLPRHQKDIVLLFWRQATDWAIARDTRELGAALSRLIIFLDSVVDEDATRLKWLAAIADAQGGSWLFAKELRRLVVTNPPVVATALLSLVQGLQYTLDYQDNILETTKLLASLGSKETAVTITEALRSLPQFRELYAQIR